MPPVRSSVPGGSGQARSPSDTSGAAARELVQCQRPADVYGVPQIAWPGQALKPKQSRATIKLYYFSTILTRRPKRCGTQRPKGTGRNDQIRQTDGLRTGPDDLHCAQP